MKFLKIAISCLLVSIGSIAYANTECSMTIKNNSQSMTLSYDNTTFVPFDTKNIKPGETEIIKYSCEKNPTFKVSSQDSRKDETTVGQNQEVTQNYRVKFDVKLHDKMTVEFPSQFEIVKSTGHSY